MNNPDFETGAAKIQQGDESLLTRQEKIALSFFLLKPDNIDPLDDHNNAEVNPIINCNEILESIQAQKKAKTTKASKYRPMGHLIPTSNCVERLFSNAKLVLSDLRKSMTPHHAELVLFLKANKHLWDEETVQSVIDAVDRVASSAGSRSTLLTPSTSSSITSGDASDDEYQEEY